VHHLTSYKPCRHTGMDCPLSSPAEPCWGDVALWSDFFEDERLYACEGHSWNLCVPYRHSDRSEDAAASFPKEKNCCATCGLRLDREALPPACPGCLCATDADGLISDDDDYLWCQ
jgi:hypothetical protein